MVAIGGGGDDGRLGEVGVGGGCGGSRAGDGGAVAPHRGTPPDETYMTSLSQTVVNDVIYQ